MSDDLFARADHIRAIHPMGGPTERCIADLLAELQAIKDDLRSARNIIAEAQGYARTALNTRATTNTVAQATNRLLALLWDDYDDETHALSRIADAAGYISGSEVELDE